VKSAKKSPKKGRRTETLDEMKARDAKAIADAAVPTEAELRAMPAPHPKSLTELTKVIAELVDRPHDYGTCVYAMSRAAAAAFNYVASVLGVTGFQASCADLDVLRLTRGLEEFALVKPEDLLYPQNDPLGEVKKYLDEARPRLAKRARELLERAPGAHPAVQRHWKEIAALQGEN
jgi:hypothetical protein